MEKIRWRSTAWIVGLTLVLGLSWPLTATAQGKTRIAVTAFENKVKTPWGDPSWKIGEGMAEMLTTELIKPDGSSWWSARHSGTSSRSRSWGRAA